jgi:hypothetical protein
MLRTARARIVNFNALFKLAVQPDDLHSVTEGKFSAVIERHRATRTVSIMCGGCENIDSSDYPPTSFGGKRWKSSSAQSALHCTLTCSIGAPSLRRWRVYVTFTIAQANLGQ